MADDDTQTDPVQDNEPDQDETIEATNIVRVAFRGGAVLRATTSGTYAGQVVKEFNTYLINSTPHIYYNSAVGTFDFREVIGVSRENIT